MKRQNKKLHSLYNGGEIQRLDLVNDGLLTCVSQTTHDEFEKYVDVLLGEGFDIRCRTEAVGNDCVTLIKDSDMIHTYYSERDKSVRIISEYDVALPDFERVSLDMHHTVASITQLKLDYDNKAYGMSYIITLADSTFILIDGGLCGGVYGDYNCEHLWEKLNELNKRPDGKIIINAWILTHAHRDHYDVMRCFSERYGSNVEIDKLIFNIPPLEYSEGSNVRDTFDGDGSDMVAIANNFAIKPKIYHPHTGQSFFIKNVRFDVVYTFEDYYPNPLAEFNSSGIVLKMTLTGNTVLWAADTYIDGCEKMVDMWGELLKSDVVQMPHHGYSTSGGMRWYNAVDAKIALCSMAFKILYQNKEVRSWLDASGTTEIVYADNSDTALLFMCEGYITVISGQKEVYLK